MLGTFHPSVDNGKKKNNATQSYFGVEQNDLKSRFIPATAWFIVTKM